MVDGTIITPEQARKDVEYRAMESALIDTTERDNAEKSIVAAIHGLAQKYNAIADIEAMEDITIPALMEVANKYNVNPSDMVELMTGIQINVLQLQAVTGEVWAECWQGLKGRFVQWWQEINM